MAQMSVGDLIAQLRTAAEDNTVINPYRDLMKVSVIALRSLANALAVATRDDPDAVTNDEPEEPPTEPSVIVPPGAFGWKTT